MDDELDVDIDTLEGLALKATPGPWFGPRVTDDWPPGWVGVYEADEEGPIPGAKVFITGRHDGEEANGNARYIAAADPDTMIKLVARIRRLQVYEQLAKIPDPTPDTRKMRECAADTKPWTRAKRDAIREMLLEAADALDRGGGGNV